MFIDQVPSASLRLRHAGVLLGLDKWCIIEIDKNSKEGVHMANWSWWVWALAGVGVYLLALVGGLLLCNFTS
ncbi:MAG: hypothetical protein FWB76_06360 [Oscillospiraceae bacterium]|nr:hypothetical protein [Oscillospiraceae bacterium]